MSLINDALKRASKSDQYLARNPGTYEYVEAVAEPPRRTLSPWGMVGLVIALGLAVCFIWQCWEASRWSGVPKEEDAVVEEPAAPAVIQPKVVAQAPAPAPQPVAPAPATNAAPAAPPPKPVEPPWPVDLKVSVIFYSQTNARALINGQTVRVGDTLGGIRITDIMKDGVSVEWQGKSKDVMME
jgi:hypothetical protein